MRKKQKRITEDQQYAKFLQDPEEEDRLRQAVLKPGKVKPIHLDHRLEEVQEVEWDNILNKPCLYTCSEIDAFLNAQDELSELEDVNLTSPGRHSFLIYDEVNSKWIDYTLDLDFEDSVNTTASNIWQALCILIRLEDDLSGMTLTVEDSL